MTSRISKKPSGTSSEKSSAAARSDLDEAAIRYKGTLQPRCVTCRNVAASEKIREYVKRVDAGTLNLPVPGLLRVLQANHHYQFGLNALYRHIRECVRARG